MLDDESSCAFINKRREQDECAGGTGSSAIASRSVREKAAEAGTTQTGSITDRERTTPNDKARSTAARLQPSRLPKPTLPPPRTSAVQIVASSNLSRPMRVYTTRPNLPPQAHRVRPWTGQPARGHPTRFTIQLPPPYRSPYI